jgi:hypothetical protein
VAAAEVKADLTGSVRAVKEEAAAAPAKVKEAAGSAAGEVRDAASKAKDQVAAKVRRDGREQRDEEDQGGPDRG